MARLADGDATLTEIAERYDVSIQAVSKHLTVLENAGLISRTRRAQARPAHLEAEVFDLMNGWIERYRRRAEQRYQRLDAVLAEATALMLPSSGEVAPPTAVTEGQTRREWMISAL